MPIILKKYSLTFQRAPREDKYLSSLLRGRISNLSSLGVDNKLIFFHIWEAKVHYFVEREIKHSTWHHAQFYMILGLYALQIVNCKQMYLLIYVWIISILLYKHINSILNVLNWFCDEFFPDPDVHFAVSLFRINSAASCSS